MNHLYNKLIINKILLFIVYIAPVFTFKNGILSTIAVILVMVSVIILFFYDDFFLVLPILIFFYSQLVLSNSLVVFRIYSILFLFKVLLSKKIRLSKRFITPFLLILFYSLLVVSTVNLRAALTIIFDTAFIMLYISQFLTEKSNIFKFFRFFAFSAASASIYGIFTEKLQLKTAVLIDGNWINVTRFLATFADPNYLGFFFNIAIFSTLCIEIFKNKIIKWTFIAIFYASLLATLSTTGLLCNLVGLIIFGTLKKGFSFKYFIIIICMIPVAIYIYNFGLQEEIPIITDAAHKIQSKIMNLPSNNFDKFTTDRSVLWSEHLDYFKSQQTYKVLFGGNLINVYFVDESKFPSVSHQDLIDMLLCIGILGTLLLMSFYVFNVIKKLLSYYRCNNEEDLLIVMIKYIWLFYAFGLTMFPAWWFYIFFFI